MRRRPIALLACFTKLCLAVAIVLPASSRAEDVDPALLTVAEKSDFRATARYAEVVALCERLAAASPLVKLSSLGKSGEGRDLPLLFIADPPVSTPEEVAKYTASGEKLLV